ncbi:MAG: CYTH domain-containing protein [Spirulinaceae cyanobacterium RM2_2_10]|nr:CYTH domain-containing protein [Spirulinaceae cyanobacterium SM2_1_0]NJO18933.1 CYTH domain-containing protein [Spirulinaceae cyanobacterium RM2_2_10]
MAVEIERKFLVSGEGWRAGAVGVYYCQGYLNRDPERTVRVRIAGDRAYLTIKSKAVGLSRLEFEYEIPVTDARELLQLGDRPPLEKTRYRLPQGAIVWEIDEFAGRNQGLIVAEVELTSTTQTFEYPDWLGPEVSHDPRYTNASLVDFPFSQWEQQLSGDPAHT